MNPGTDASIACSLSESTLWRVINLKLCNRIYHDLFFVLSRTFRLSRCNMAQYNFSEASIFYSLIIYLIKFFFNIIDKALSFSFLEFYILQIILIKNKCRRYGNQLYIFVIRKLVIF